MAVKPPEDGLTPVNDNDHQANAEEFREEKGKFHSCSQKS